MSSLYPVIKENRHFFLKADDVHEIYVEESGNPDGEPVVYLHGGPGAGSNPMQRRLFNPEKYRIILFDQRGCGRSRPHASLENNTTQHLIEDMEMIREHLGISKWIVAGGSWGSTLSLVYAQAYPERVKGLIVRGIFLATQAEMNWLYQQGASQFFPEHWQDFIASVPEAERDNMLQAYHRLLTGDNDLIKMRAAKNWSAWEAHAATLLPSTEMIKFSADPHTALSLARIETHYFVNNSFIEEGVILARAERIAHIPAYIVHGRYDMICQLQRAYDLHQVLPMSELLIVQAAGHVVSEPGIGAALVTASDGLLRRIN